jgi:cytochrome c oxidase assembly factor CtaG
LSVVRFAFDPVIAAMLLLAALLYIRALRVLRGRNLRATRGQQACWWIGLGLLAFGLLGPPDAYDADLMSAHMAQHLLIGDVAAPFLLAGMRTPVLFFYLPRAALVLLARRRWLRRVFRVLRRPLVALPLYVLTIYSWHLGALFEGALRHPLLHALQHECFIAANLLLWWPVIEPARRRMGGQLWKIGYIFAARMSTMFLGMVFVFSRGILYADAYGRGMREGISAMSDQQTAGGLMMSLDIVIMIVAASWFFWNASQEHDASGAPKGPGGTTAAPAQLTSPPLVGGPRR